MKGGLVGAKTSNLSCQSLDLVNTPRGASFSGRGDLGGVGEVQLWRMGMVIGLVSGRGAGFAHLVTSCPLSYSYPFPTPNPL